MGPQRREFGKGAGFRSLLTTACASHLVRPKHVALQSRGAHGCLGRRHEARNPKYFQSWASSGRASAVTTRRFPFALGGATGSVTIRNGVIEIIKTNDRGNIVIEGPSFETETNRWLRLAADVEVESSNGDICHGFVRAHGRHPSYGVDELFERDYAGGGIPQSHGLPESTKDRTYRKYCAYANKDGHVVPVIVVTGSPSVSTWRNWVVMDMRAETDAWREAIKPMTPKIRDRERMDEAEYDRGVAADFQHTAKGCPLDGVELFFMSMVKKRVPSRKGTRMHRVRAFRREKFAGGQSRTRASRSSSRTSGSARCRVHAAIGLRTALT